MSSTVTGSPVDEEAFIQVSVPRRGMCVCVLILFPWQQLQLEQCMQGLHEQLADDMVRCTRVGVGGGE